MDLSYKNNERIEKLEKELLLYKEALNSAPNPIFIKDEDAKFIFFNKSYERFFGVNRFDLIGTTVEQSTYLDEKNKFRYHIEDTGALENQSAISYEDKFLRWDGEMVPALYWSNGFKLQSGERGLIGEVVDLAKVRNIESELLRSALGENVDMAVIGSGADDVLQFYSTVLNYYDAEKILIFEFDHNEHLIQNVANFRRDGDKLFKEEQLPSGNLDGIRGTLPYIRENVASYVERENYIIEDDLAAAFLSGLDSIIYMILISEERPVGLIVLENPKINTNKLEIIQSTGPFVVDDIKKHNLVDKIKHMNFVDKLTGIHNRDKYKTVLKSLEEDKPYSIGILVADVNGLGIINKHYGEQSGDAVIKYSANMLYGIFKDEVYRIGDDEFVVLSPNVDCEEFDKSVAELLSKVRNNKYKNLSFGYTCAEGSYDLTAKIAYVNELLLVEKQSYYKEFSSEEAKILNYSQSITNDLLNEINEGKFTIFLQPQIDLKTGEVASAEALVRKFDNAFNILSPQSFLPAYENEKIIRHLDLFVVEEVVKTQARWENIGISMKIAINLSRVTLMERDIIDEIANICKKYGVSHKNIEIEVTETSNRIDNSQLQSVIKKAMEKGFLVSLDDFGSEYSNLLMITSNEFTQIKFDKSLIDGICTDPKASTIVEYAVKMCSELGINNMLAEGIESEEQAIRLKDINCRYGQGYFFAKPMTVADFEKRYFKV